MVVYEWTDASEKTLDAMRQNAAKLGEISLGNYDALKKRIHYLQLPLAILSAANAYAVMDLDHYVSENYVTIGCCVVSATLAGYLSYDWYVDSQKQMEKDFSFHRNCEEFSKQIKEVLSVPRYDRNTDGATFVREKFKQYKILIFGNKLIEKFQGDMTAGKDSLLSGLEEDMDEFVMDNLNIIFRPTLRRFKKKNSELIECVKKGGQSVSAIVEPTSKTADSNDKVKNDTWKWLSEKLFGVSGKEVPKNDIEKGVVQEETAGEETKEEHKEDSDNTMEEKPVNFSDVYEVKDGPSMNFPTKKFHVAFTEQI